MKQRSELERYLILRKWQFRRAHPIRDWTRYKLGLRQARELMLYGRSFDKFPITRVVVGADSVRCIDFGPIPEIDV